MARRCLCSRKEPPGSPRVRPSRSMGSIRTIHWPRARGRTGVTSKSPDDMTCLFNVPQMGFDFHYVPIRRPLFCLPHHVLVAGRRRGPAKSFRYSSGRYPQSTSRGAHALYHRALRAHRPGPPSPGLAASCRTEYHLDRRVSVAKLDRQLCKRNGILPLPMPFACIGLHRRLADNR